MTAWQWLQRAAALSVLVLLFPGLVVLGGIVRATSPGPALHRAQRVGRHGRPITIHKIRSMSVGASSVGPAITRRDDPRVTAIGTWMRARRIDELPQLWDVARGRMLLVGPRPEDPEFVDLRDAVWQSVLRVPPGITGPTQLAYHEENEILADDPERAYREQILPGKLASDLRYVRTRSVRGDLGILLATARFVARTS